MCPHADVIVMAQLETRTDLQSNRSPFSRALQEPYRFCAGLYETNYYEAKGHRPDDSLCAGSVFCWSDHIHHAQIFLGKHGLKARGNCRIAWGFQ